MCTTTRLERLCASQSKKQFDTCQTIQRVGHKHRMRALTVYSSGGYDAPMPIELGINAEFADLCYICGDHYRQHAGGGHKPVSYPHGGMSGVRRLQHGLDRNTRIVSTETTQVPDNFWSFVIFICEKTIMGAPSLLSLLAYPLAVKPHYTAPKPHYLPVATPLVFTESPTGIIALLDRVPVAWIVCGYHHGAINKQPHTCHFVDVVYHRQTQRGVNLETLEADSIEDAKAQLNRIFAPTHSTQGGAQ
ncbi:MAG: hypothetical protein WAQ53_07940 [Thiofilum sp.]|uniref:hypothetical protein n=1 Tax=Thiofilum sp. TaxID=2212733 RepID=UPI0025E14CC2|nr:hypothetical protein [Thiofilum sp.]MBK8454112.1 hypothetical protein [Thiofilum sp.]